ncbi:hypothetical protein ACFVT5_25325 [Streptomyces sp. NPDC058001]|uniref:hypothetical protein n=1 Tax=Streptomyces sp. NPDC058001 TaxID=3346300 RepID=UPI0036F00DC0
MRALPARRLATTAVCAALLIGTAAPVFAADGASAPGAHAAQGAPVPGVDALLAQSRTLNNAGGVLTPVTDLLTAVLKADNGQLPAADAAKLAASAKAAIDAAKATAPAPGSPAAGAVHEKAPMDVKADALAALQSAVDALVKAATAGDVAAVVKQAPVVVTGLVNFLAATLLGGGLPAANLPGLPALPALPADPAAPSLPAAPTVPTLPS